MLDRGEWIIEMVQEGTPSLVIGGQPKANRMVLEFPPMDKKNVTCWRFDAGAQFVGNVTGHRSDDGRRLAKGGDESIVGSGTDVENCDFENHGFLAF